MGVQLFLNYPQRWIAPPHRVILGGYRRIILCIALTTWSTLSRSTQAKTRPVNINLTDNRSSIDAISIIQVLLTGRRIHNTTVADDKTVFVARLGQLKVCLLNLHHSLYEVTLKSVSCNQIISHSLSKPYWKGLYRLDEKVFIAWWASISQSASPTCSSGLNKSWQTN